MHKRITFKNTQHSDHLEQHAQQQLAKIEKFLVHEKTPITIDLVIEPSKTREHHKIELLVNSPQYHKVIKYEHNGVPCYEAVDHVIDLMYKELHEAKERIVDNRRRQPHGGGFNVEEPAQDDSDE